MHRTRCYSLLLALFLCTCDRAQPPRDPVGDDAPNILFILTDDQGIGDLSLHDNDSIRTPNMDALLSSGAKFEPLLRQPRLRADPGQFPLRPVPPAHRGRIRYPPPRNDGRRGENLAGIFAEGRVPHRAIR